MKKLYVVGNPVEHSKSPEIHNHWLKKYNRDYQYEKLKLSLDDKIFIEQKLDLIKKIREGEIKGINITVPFKTKFIDALDEVDESDEAESVHDDREALLASYEWYESSDFVKYLQEVLDIKADGVYGPNTRATHLAALEKEGLPIDGVPEVGPIPCPDDEPLPDTQAVGMSSFVADMDGDGNLETVNVQEGIGPDEDRFFAVATGNEFGTRWVETEFPEDEWRKGYVTDINDDQRDEFWVTHPGSASVTHYSIIIFDDCEMKIARIPDSNDLWRSGGTVMSSWEIKCQDATPLGGEPLHYLKQIRYRVGSGDEELTSIWTYEFTGSGFEFVNAVIDEFWPTSIEGWECERWYQLHPTDPNY